MTRLISLLCICLPMFLVSCQNSGSGGDVPTGSETETLSSFEESDSMSADSGEDIPTDDPVDECPSDPDKTEAGECGCGNPEGTCSEIPEDAVFSQLVYPGEEGKLIYEPDPNGNILPDFSYVGYKNGEEQIPTVPVVKVISPVDGDNRAHIQDAIDQVAAMPLENGLRGALLLKQGEYRVSGTIYVKSSGIVIRGEGNEETGTRVIATQKTKHDFFVFDGSDNPREDVSSKVKIIGAYIPVGARGFVVEPHGFKVGDDVFVTREPNQSWIEMLGMDKLENPADPDDFNWTPAEYTMKYKRIIKGVQGNQITIDAPMVDPIDENYATGYVSKYVWSGKIMNVGVEDIRLVSEYSGEEDESHGWNAVVMDRVQDGWAKNVIAYYFGYATVDVRSHAYRISVLKCENMYPKSQTTGGRKYSFAVNGQLVLVKDCYANSGRHDFVTHARTPGPSAFVDCVAEDQKSDIGPHHRWSTGILFDNILGDGAMNVQNRMYSGSGHGWAGAQILFWNSSVNQIIIQSPPNHINWSIGNKAGNITSKGSYVDVPGYTESNNVAVWPRSLYAQQLEDRLGP